MKTISNIHNSDIYRKTWMKYFKDRGAAFDFPVFGDISFYQIKSLPLYCNVGSNHSLDNPYTTDSSGIGTDHCSKAFLIYHVPDHSEHIWAVLPENIGRIRIKDVPGYLVDLSGYKNFDGYLNEAINKKTQANIRRRKRKLEKEFSIEYAWIEDMEKQEYQEFMSSFERLLRKRYSSKKEQFRKLQPNIWQFYKELWHELMKEQLARFFVIYADSEPISVSLDYHTDNGFMQEITVFDTDFNKYGVGTISLLESLKEAFSRKMRYFDLKMGNYGYKDRWCNKRYHLEYHILYEKGDARSFLIAKGLSLFLRLKISLRDSGIKQFLPYPGSRFNVD